MKREAKDEKKGLVHLLFFVVVEVYEGLCFWFLMLKST